MTCSHIDEIQDVDPKTPDGCEECLKSGSRWVHLRICRTCGHVGCCWGECAKLGSRPVSPYLAEAAVIYTFLMGLEGIYYWDARGLTGPVGWGRSAGDRRTDVLGDIEFAIKGLHRVSQFGPLLEGKHSFIRPVRHEDTWNRDHPVIRGILADRHLVLAMANPYLDPGESQEVEVWYDAPHRDIARAPWSGKVRIESRRTHLFHCRLPALPGGAAHDPDRLFFRYELVDGTFRKTFTVTGNYEVEYPYREERGDGGR